MVFNDALRARQQAHAAGLPCPTDAELSRRHFASFVVEADPAALPKTEPGVGIDLGSLTSPSCRTAGSRRSAVPAPRGEEAQAQAAGPVPQAERFPQPGQGQAQGRPRARPSGRRPARLPPPAVHEADPRQPSDRRRGPGGERARPHPAGQIRPRRRMVSVRGHAGIQVSVVWPTVRPHRPVHSNLADLLPVRGEDGAKPLHVRAWRCQGCGAWLDRDINAAVNVARAAGLAVTACRAQVRPGPTLAPRGEAGTPPKSYH